MKITTIIFDLGNVLVDFCWEKHFHSFGFSSEVFDRLAKATVMDSSWNLFDKGVLQEDELLQIFIANDPGIEKEIRMMFQNISGTIEPYTYAEDWIRELQKAGYRVLILSNYSEKSYRECGEKLSFVNIADGAVISYREKMVKPDLEIYQLLLDRYHLTPQECVFLDDKQENIEGAKKAGMNGIVFTTRENAIKELEKLGVRYSDTVSDKNS